MTLTWHDPAGVDGAGSDGQTGGDHVLAQTDLAHGQQMSFTVHYDGWPTQLAQDGSRDSLPTDDDPSVNPGYDPGYDPNYDGDSGFGIAQIIILLVVLIIIIRILSASDGYRGGFGTHYVFVNGLWFPAGPDGRPRPGAHGTREKPRPPRGGGGFGGGSRGGGFGGSGFGGGGHCACASSCACACACACAGGGRAGCSSKNLYGAVHLDRDVTHSVEE